jgi:cell surface protein SprA
MEFNWCFVPQGSVVVTAGGRLLMKVDYSVNYQLGRVQILDPALQTQTHPLKCRLKTTRFWTTNQKIHWFEC